MYIDPTLAKNYYQTLTNILSQVIKVEKFITENLASLNISQFNEYKKLTHSIRLAKNHQPDLTASALLGMVGLMGSILTSLKFIDSYPNFDLTSIYDLLENFNFTSKCIYQEIFPNADFDLALEAMGYAQSYIHMSGTKIESNKLPLKELFRIDELIDKTRDEKEFFEKKYNLKKFIYTPKNPLEYLIYRNEIVKENLIGNCGEYTDLVLEYLLIKNCYVDVTGYHIKNGDHEFIVIEPVIGSDPSNYLTWGANAIVCDPWANLCYPACLIPYLLKTYRSCEFVEINGEEKVIKRENVFENIDFSKHTLKRDLSLRSLKETFNRKNMEFIVDLAIDRQAILKSKANKILVSMNEKCDWLKRAGDQSKIKIIQNKMSTLSVILNDIEKIEKFMQEKKDHFKNLTPNYINYKKLNSLLNQSICDSVSKIMDLFELSGEKSAEQKLDSSFFKKRESLEIYFKFLFDTFDWEIRSGFDSLGIDCSLDQSSHSP